MKKLAIGCLIIVVVAGAAIVGVGYYGYLKVRSTVSQFAELAKVRDIESGVRVKTTFSPPDSGELTPHQVDQMIRIQTRVRERLGVNFAAFERNYKSLLDKKEATVVDLPALISAYRDLAATWLDAKRAQVDALNETGISMQEYRWIRSQAYRSLGIPFVDLDFGRLAEQVQSGKISAEVPAISLPTTPGTPASLRLLEPHRKQIEDYMPLVAFGL